VKRRNKIAEAPALFLIYFIFFEGKRESPFGSPPGEEKEGASPPYPFSQKRKERKGLLNSSLFYLLP